MNARRGRPPAYDRDAAMLAIVETFRRQGFAATSLDDIVAATGMNRPSLFAAFGNKKAMYLAALAHFRDAIADVVRPALLDDVPLRTALNAFFYAAIDFYCNGEARGCLVLCTASAEALTDSDIGAVLADTLSDIEKQIEDRIECHGVQDGSLNVGDAADMAKLLSAVLISIAMQARAGIGKTDLRRFATKSVALVMASTS